MLTAPIVDKTGRSVKKNANKFKGVVANKTMDVTGRFVHMKLRGNEKMNKIRRTNDQTK
jgi:hypothetical protein